MILYPADHPIYQPCDPPISAFGLLEAVNTGHQVGYRRGFQDGLASAPPTIQRVTVKKIVREAVDKDRAIARVRALSEAMNRQMEGRAKTLVDFDTMQRNLFKTILDELEAL